MIRALRRYGNWIKNISLLSLTFLVQSSGRNLEIKEAMIMTVLVASKIRVPTLLIHSQSDDQTSSWQSVDINKKLNQNYAIFITPNGDPDTVKTLQIIHKKYEALIDDFFAKKTLKWPYM